MHDEDRDIVRAVQNGETERFRELVDRHRGRVYAVLQRMLANPPLAEELAQEAFVKAYTGLNGFRGDARFGTWLVQIALFTARDHLRRARRMRQKVTSLEELRARHAAAGDPADLRPAADPLRNLAGQQGENVVHEALDSLPDEYREVLVLKHLEEWPYERIAELTGDTVGTLKVRAHRARRMLKEQLRARGWSEDGTTSWRRLHRAE